jgi:hypothetical protein
VTLQYGKKAQKSDLLQERRRVRTAFVSACLGASKERPRSRPKKLPLSRKK